MPGAVRLIRTQEGNLNANKVREVISEQFGVPIEEVSDETTFVDLDADILHIIEMTMALEESVGMKVPDEDIDRISTVGQLISYVEQIKG
jgi:acyl carrier protein